MNNLQVAREEFPSEYADALTECGLIESEVNPGNAGEVLHALNRILDGGEAWITRIYARGFKGMDFDQSLALRTVITGRIGSGKSSRALALALLVTGSLPGTGIAKSNSDILNAVGNGRQPDCRAGI